MMPREESKNKNNNKTDTPREQQSSRKEEPRLVNLPRKTERPSSEMSSRICKPVSKRQTMLGSSKKRNSPSRPKSQETNPTKNEISAKQFEAIVSY